MADKEIDPKKVEDPKTSDDKKPRVGDKSKKNPGKVKNKVDLTPELEEDPGGAPLSYEGQPGLNEALNTLQRMHRAQVMRRIQPKIKRAKEIAQSRIAKDPKLHDRSMRAAREIIRNKIAGHTGTSYADMDPASKQRIDKQLESRVGAIKRLAQRLFPKVRKAEQDRHHEFTHKSMIDHKAKTMSEAYDKTDGAADPQHTTRYKQEVIVGSDGKRKVVNRAVKIKSLEERVELGLQKKADQSGFDRETIDEVYTRGLNEFNSNNTPTLTREQFAFGRVNKFLADQSIDEDLSTKFRRNIKRG